MGWEQGGPLKYCPTPPIEQSTPESFLFLQRGDVPSINVGHKNEPWRLALTPPAAGLSRACLPTDAYEAENEEELEAAPEA